jgi:hypothetical protein
MTDVRPGGRRRIDRVLASDFLDGLGSLPIGVLRVKRRDAEAEEADLSYLRRLLHGRIDIVRAEQTRRARAMPADRPDGVMLDELPMILAGRARGSRPFSRMRHLVPDPPRADRQRRRVERLVANVDLSDVNARTDDELERVLRTYQAEERHVSEVRARVQQVLDQCSGELARRYVDGETSVAELLAPNLRAERQGRAN